MGFGKIILAAAATSLAVAPAMAAAANPAASLSLSSARTGKAVTRGSKQAEGSNTGIIIGVIAAIVVGVGIYVVADSNDKADSR